MACIIWFSIEFKVLFENLNSSKQLSYSKYWYIKRIIGSIDRQQMNATGYQFNKVSLLSLFRYPHNSKNPSSFLPSILLRHIYFTSILFSERKPTTFATLTYNSKKKLFFGLPGNPVSAVVTCNLYVISAVNQMAGDEDAKRTIIKAKVSILINH